MWQVFESSLLPMTILEQKFEQMKLYFACHYFASHYVACHFSLAIISLAITVFIGYGYKAMAIG